MKAAFYTLGCKVNQYESEYMAELLEKEGVEIVSPNDNADIYIINSCTVTATADQKTRQNVRKFKRKHPDSIVILTGCMPQAFKERSINLTEADIVISNKNNDELVSYVRKYMETKNRLVNIEAHQKGDAFKSCSIQSFNDRIRAFVKIEDGCDRFCTYCIIPMSRGRVRSKKPEELKQEIHNLGLNGIKEIVLVGINLSSYGKGEDFNIVDAVKICNDDENIVRVRLGSLEPDYITDDVIEGFAECEKFCPQFHLSLQSGCDKTLRNMNRHYTCQEYKDLCTKLRNTFEDTSITTDVMVGFHEEDENDFLESVKFVEEIGFEKVHVFPYSQREGTVASRRGDNVSKEEKEKRAHAMIKATDKIRNEFLNNQIGKTVNVLFENEIEPNVYQGYTKNYTPVRMNSNEDIIGQELDVTIKSVDVNLDCCFA